LVLRRWCNFRPERRFRCLVRDSRLAVVSQFDLSGAYDYLDEQVTKDHLCHLIQTFFDTEIRGKFAQPTYIFDVYVETTDKVWLLQFKPAHESTNLCLIEVDDWEPSASTTCGDPTTAVHQDVKLAPCEYRVVPRNIGNIVLNAAAVKKFTQLNDVPIDLKNLAVGASLSDAYDRFSKQQQTK